MSKGSLQLILKHLKTRQNVSSSSHLIEFLQLNSVSHEAARQVVSRGVSSGILKSVKGINLKAGSKIIYIAGLGYREGLLKTLLESESVYSDLIRVLIKAGCKVPVNFLKTHSSLTIKNRVGHVSFENAINALKEANLIIQYEDIRWGSSIELHGRPASTDLITDSYLEMESMFFETFVSWVCKTNLTTKSTIEIRANGNVPEYGGLAWDFKGPSFINGLTEFKADGTPINGFMVGDFWLQEKLTLKQINYFLKKLDMVRTVKTTFRPILPFFVFNDIEPSALKALKAKGVMTVHVGSFFGANFGKSLLGIREALDHISTSVSNNPLETADYFKKLVDLGGVNNNLRGTLFEFIIARMSYLHGEEVVGIKQKVKDENGIVITDIDVQGKQGKVHHIAYECKAMIEGNFYSKTNLNDWNKRTLPKLYEWIRDYNKVNKSQFSLIIRFCVSTDYHPDCLPLIADIIKKNSRVQFEFYNKEKVLKFFKAKNENEIIELYKELL